MTDREAMKQALEALEYIYEGANNQGPHTGISWRDVSNKAEPIITALRQALANEALDRKAENARELGLRYDMTCPDCEYHKNRAARWRAEAYKLIGHEIELPWVGLTDEEIWKAISRIGTSDSDVNPYAKLADARAIEAKLKEKNNG